MLKPTRSKWMHSRDHDVADAESGKHRQGQKPEDDQCMRNQSVRRCQVGELFPACSSNANVAVLIVATWVQSSRSLHCDRAQMSTSPSQPLQKESMLGSVGDVEERAYKFVTPHGRSPHSGRSHYCRIEMFLVLITWNKFPSDALFPERKTSCYCLSISTESAVSSSR
ncbi:hypothetical protein Ae201684P_002855 [Aphanomyces euteiches]|nr:hypothetical protein Ae201684P_002855 [Aphanomyces euteiches]